MADSVAVSTIDSPPEWDGLSPDIVLKCCKTAPPEVLRASGVHDFYKSYPSWVKMSQDQKNKSLAWFRSLPEETQGILFFTVSFFLLIDATFFSIESIVDAGIMAEENTKMASAAANSASDKDDIARLINMFKEPLAQRHWTDLYSVLTQSELDIRKSGGNYAVPANPLASLAEIFNDSDNFVPQNLMLRYVTSQQHSKRERPMLRNNIGLFFKAVC